MPSESAQPASEYEERTRIFCHLPVNTNSGMGDVKIIRDVVQYLENQRKKSVNLKGYTKTIEFPSVMEGFWRSSTRKQFLKEDVVMFIIDFELTIRDAHLWEAIADLKAFVKAKYLQHMGKAQDEVWVVAHSIFRLK